MKIVFSWNELPKYAAYLLKELVKDNPNLEIISIKSHLPIKGLDKIIKKKIHWLDDKNLKWSDLNLDVPDIFFQAGWSIKAFISLGREVKKNGGKVILLSDNSYRGTLRQKIGSVLYILKYVNYFDAVWVPGYLGTKLMKFFGVKKKNIFKCLYSSNDKIYTKGLSINKRPKNFLFIGQLIKRKGFEELLNSFKFFSKNNPEWKLIIVGEGPLKKLIPKNNSIKHFNFKHPEQVAKYMNKSRFLILPSYYDHWPLVVNEASLCGCGLILSDKIGNIPEFSRSKNSIICKSSSVNSLTFALEKASKLSEIKLDRMFEESVKLGSKFTISNWVKNYYKILRYLKN
jgi:glycosyltransferase involved in cell wall biosynthesis